MYAIYPDLVFILYHMTLSLIDSSLFMLETDEDVQVNVQFLIVS